jgi:hypothetical protein
MLSCIYAMFDLVSNAMEIQLVVRSAGASEVGVSQTMTHPATSQLVLLETDVPRKKHVVVSLFCPVLT